MRGNPLLGHILDDDALTRGLGDAEARVLVEYLVEQAEQLAWESEREEACREVSRLCRRGRAIGRFVYLWCIQRERGPAAQLAAAERFNWPFPEARVDPCELMQSIVAWEASYDRHSPPRSRR